ncbi:GntR family transcriptional regulator [Friedmanniella endophytica]|uniref:GntR family transcriptional regulator n=1 Tax=Microlunatus kandeliicorticis TaxID=1759536 RepID=A0A7W3INP2_9ACTN|nr:GntR family transcriptional regulator [Microlunatus kandeliicorticis]MBA8792411.1 GntR family transcriptional regulator [Microlunatus kandeliicorticis]
MDAGLRTDEPDGYPGSYRIDRPIGAATKRSQVRAILEQMIDGELHPGDAIPSERVLVDRLGVSRVTIRQAIADLVDNGALERVHGKGTYVTGPQIDSRLHLTSFSREMRDRGLIPATVVLSASEQQADDDTAYALRIRPGRPIIRVERLRTADGTPMAYEIGYYPSALFPGLLERELGALYDVFASEYGVVVTSAEQTVRAESADAHQARILGVAKRAPLLVQERVTYAGERAVELASSAYRADRYRIHMAITPRGAREN